MKLKEVLSTKNKIHDKINSITDFNAIWEYNPETRACRLVIEGNCMEKGMGKSGLTEADKEWIAGLVRPIQKDISEIKDRLTNVENRLENVENRLEAIENCPTIKKEIK